MKSFLAGALLVPTAIASVLSTSLPLIVNAQQSVGAAVPGRAAVKQAAKEEKNNRFKGDGSGTLVAMLGTGKKLGQCPLKHTSVTANVSGYVARVTVKQIFENPFKDKIEAVYTFPLSETGAVDDMRMKVAERIIKGTIKKREEAKEIYDNAKAHGQVAALLDQERPNIFTQSVANILPGNQIEVTLQYVDLLPYEAGRYTFAFPTVVGPRFMPGTPAGKTGTGRLPDTTQVPDASKISPPVAPRGERAGHDISIDVNIDSGVPITQIQSTLHEITSTQPNAQKAHISLTNKNTIPNKDFVLSWDVASEQIKSGYLTYKASKDANGYFTVMVMPPKRATPEQIQPKEMIFVIDCSGSQSGPPLDKAKETMRYIIEHMNKEDTFQIIAFSNDARPMFAKPQKVSAEMKQQALKFINHLTANGGTWMAPAVEAACKTPADSNRLRIVTFMTDGYVGNDMEILGMIKKLRGKSRWFSFGTGNGVNRFLIDAMAREGGGEAEYVMLNSSANEVGKKFYDRISSPVLTDIKLDFDGLSVKEVFPHEVSDVWAEKPLYIKGRYIKPGAGTISISGFSGGKPYLEKIKVNFPENQSGSESIASVWARAKVDRLMSEDWQGAQNGSINKELQDEIVKVALDHHIMTQYTSFVAVEEKTVTKGGVARTVVVPVEMPDGVSRETTLGESDSLMMQGATNGAVGLGGGGGQFLSRAKRRAGHGSTLPPPPLAGGYRSSQAYSLGGASNSIDGKMMASMSRPVATPAPSAPASSNGPAQAGRPSSQSGGASVGIADKRELGRLAAGKPAEAKKSQDEEKAEPARQAKDDKQQEKVSAKLSSVLQQLAGNSSALKIASSLHLRVQDGKISIEIQLTDSSEENIKALKKLGFVLVLQEKNKVIGRIAAEQLEALAKLKFVKQVTESK
ncbi:MAG: VWA domain-containing protein [Candidatus Melainabacteria bacterium]|nr:VWA domain-containing protein [Candidatus Melainabacteria bacterium]